MNLYELNKMVIIQLDPLTLEEIQDYNSQLTDFFVNSLNQHFMLLCKDFSYYTLFAYDEKLREPQFADAVFEIITELGKVFSIELTEDKGAYEIWIQPDGEEEVYAFYLFPYDMGVVYYG